MEAEERIDLYLQGKLEGKDLDIFRLRLQNDDVFAEEVETRRLIIFAIKEARQEELKAYIKEATAIDLPVVAFPIRKMMYAAVAASVLVGSAYLVFELIINEKTKNIVVKEVDADKKPEVLDTPKNNPDEVSNADTEHSDDLKVVDNDTQNQQYAVEDLQPNLVSQENVSPPKVDDNVMVMQDRMLERKLSSAYFSNSFLKDSVESAKDVQTNAPVSIESKKRELVKEKSDKNAEPQRQEADEKFDHKNFEIELWESIIHFKGYRWNGTKLLLYGIDPAENIGFQWVSDQLILQRGKDYFLLKKTNQFESYLKVTDQILLDRLLK